MKRIQLPSLPNDAGKGIYVNEDLTKKTAELFYHARMAKRSNLIKSCWTEGGILSVRKINGTVKEISSIDELKAFTLQNPNFDVEASNSSTTTCL